MQMLVLLPWLDLVASGAGVFRASLAMVWLRLVQQTVVCVASYAWPE